SYDVALLQLQHWPLFPFLALERRNPDLVRRRAFSLREYDSHRLRRLETQVSGCGFRIDQSLHTTLHCTREAGALT
ncbi:MAG TPA: hypothetical protein VI816_02505, partial [Candidatus Bathyarchaeia archaeon]|nr:hypothetical protein [Candidatus Bathyarchaeia archaeon]